MAGTTDWTSGESRTDSGSTSAMRPRMSVADFILQLWRAKWLMMLVFLPIFAFGLMLAMMMPETYQASSRLYVQLGPESVYRPVVGSEGAGAFLEQEQVVQGEIEILQSPVIAERVLRDIGLARLYPDIVEGLNKKLETARPSERAALQQEAFQTGVLAIQKDFGVASAPKRPVVATFFTHPDPALAADVLNRMVDTYLDYRTLIFVDPSSDSLKVQRERFESLLLESEIEIRNFLIKNGIGDFESERETTQIQFATISGALLENNSRISAVEGQLSSLRGQLTSVPEAIDLHVDDSTNQTLIDLQLEREDLLVRYTPDSRVVQALDKRIEQAEAFLAAKTGPVGTTRRGPNPIYTDIASAAANLQAEAQSLAQQRTELTEQLADVRAKQRAITELTPRYQELQRAKALYEENVRAFATREVEAKSRLDLGDTENIRVLEKATPPVEGSSLKMPVAALAFLFAGFTALVLGLLWAMTRSGFSTARSVERTVGLPVLSSTKRR